MKSPYRPSIVLLAGLLLVAAVGAEDAPPMMVKSQSGVPLGGDVDLDMCSPEGVAIGGFDLVSYRQESGPQRDNAQWSHDHEGKTYWFTGPENRDAFSARPNYYLPAYSGFCAITLALGRVTCPQYDNFKIEAEELLLFEVTGFTNGRTLWNSDPAGYRRQADDNFLQLRAE